ncbi:MAG: hypothetical protein HFJ55_00965 [Clostridia bacterium]|jgi:hypothetical protein|nr:hypothetical protein [Clostridia bacterium]
MGALIEGIRELIHNFTSPIEDANMVVDDISSDNFVAIAKRSGLSLEDISELSRNRNGIELVSKKKTSKVRETSKGNTIETTEGVSKRREDKEMER